MEVRSHHKCYPVCHAYTCKYIVAQITQNTSTFALKQTTNGINQTACVHACVLTRDWRAPSSTRMESKDWSLFWEIVARLQSRKSPRHLLSTSGLVMNLSRPLKERHNLDIPSVDQQNYRQWNTAL